MSPASAHDKRQWRKLAVISGYGSKEHQGRRSALIAENVKLFRRARPATPGGGVAAAGWKIRQTGSKSQPAIHKWTAIQ